MRKVMKMKPVQIFLLRTYVCERGLFKKGLVSFFPKIWDFSKTTEGIQNRFRVEIDTRFRVVLR